MTDTEAALEFLASGVVNGKMSVDISEAICNLAKKGYMVATWSASKNDYIWHLTERGKQVEKFHRELEDESGEYSGSGH